MAKAKKETYVDCDSLRAEVLDAATALGAARAEMEKVVTTIEEHPYQLKESALDAPTARYMLAKDRYEAFLGLEELAGESSYQNLLEDPRYVHARLCLDVAFS
jgi:hypothetical protein